MKILFNVDVYSCPVFRLSLLFSMLFSHFQSYVTQLWHSTAGLTCAQWQVVHILNTYEISPIINCWSTPKVFILFKLHFLKIIIVIDYKTCKVNVLWNPASPDVLLTNKTITCCPAPFPRLGPEVIKICLLCVLCAVKERCFLTLVYLWRRV